MGTSRSQKSNANKRSNAIALNFLGNQDNPQVWITVNLPLNLDLWLLRGNYLDAISTVVTSYVDPNPDHGGGDSQEQLESSDVLIS